MGFTMDANISIYFQNYFMGMEVIEVKRSFSRSPRLDFVVFTTFVIKFSSFSISMNFNLGDLCDLIRGTGNFFKNYIFEISAFK